MTQYTADLPITVDLSILAKYHVVTKLKVDRLTKQDIPTNNYSDTLKVFVIKSEEEGLHPAFDYWKYTEEVGLDETTANNLLYLIYVNCLYEWRVYSETLVTADPSKNLSLVANTLDELNLVLNAHEQLNKIRDLCLLLESHPEETDIKFSYRSGSEKRGKEMRETYKVLGISISDKKQVESILIHAIEVLFKEAQYVTISD